MVSVVHLEFDVGFTEVAPTVGGERGAGGSLYYITATLCHHQNDFRINMGSDVSQFNVYD